MKEGVVFKRVAAESVTRLSLCRTHVDLWTQTSHQSLVPSPVNQTLMDTLESWTIFIYIYVQRICWSQTLVSITAGNSIGASAKPLSDDITGETGTASHRLMPNTRHVRTHLLCSFQTILTGLWDIPERIKAGQRSDSLGFGLGVGDLADVDGVGGVRDVSLLLHVRGGDGQQRSVDAERQRRDAGRVTVELTQTLLVERIPNVHEAVGAACAQTQTQNSSLFDLFSPNENWESVYFTFNSL